MPLSLGSKEKLTKPKVQNAYIKWGRKTKRLEAANSLRRQKASNDFYTRTHTHTHTYMHTPAHTCTQKRVSGGTLPAQEVSILSQKNTRDCGSR